MDVAAIPALTEAFDAAVADQLAARGLDMPSADEPYDGPLSLAALTPELLTSIESLGPYGVGFPAPRFLIEEAEVDFVRLLQGKHLSLALRQDGALVDAIAFNQAEQPLSVGDRIAAIYVPTRSVFRGRWRLQLQIEAFWPARGGF